MTRRRKTATVDDLMDWGPCWDTDRIIALAGRRKRWSWKAVVALRGSDGISNEHWFWLATQFLDHCGRSDINRLTAAKIASTLLRAERKAGREPHPASFAAVRVARRHARGRATDAELLEAYSTANAARIAARTTTSYTTANAACSAARESARSAAYSAAYVAARESARSAAYSAAYVAACEAAYSAAYGDACSALIAVARKECLE